MQGRAPPARVQGAAHVVAERGRQPRLLSDETVVVGIAGAVGAVLARVGRGLQAGPFARVMGYRTNPRHGYFAPTSFAVLEGRAVYTWQRNRWGVRADGGLGGQQVLRGTAYRTEWHFGVTLSRDWGANDAIALTGSVTNSAGATSSGAFRYRTIGLRFTQGL
ncbi:MAG: hypothetical protein AUH42_00330 [Gemmatimonadetes bacterium 13_1_40CM_70_11]|nr:MAG: hypothetical protein AUH42_00330 [Gemmatimonadetes bacterium 13_1_40CM_70_11]